MTFQAVIFDLDGTLVDSEGHALRVGQSVFAEYGLELPEATFRNMIGYDFQHARRALREAFPETVPFDEIDRLWRERSKAEFHRYGIPLRPQVTEVLEAITAKGLPMAIATASRREVARLKIRKSGLGRYFQAVITREDVTIAKPSPEAYFRAAEALDLAPSACLAFEDSDPGTQAARAAGMTVVQIPDLAPASGHHANLIASDLMEGARQIGLL